MRGPLARTGHCQEHDRARPCVPCLYAVVHAMKADAKLQNRAVRGSIEILRTISGIKRPEVRK